MIEDDLKLSRLVKEFLQRHDYEVALETRGDRAIDRMVQEVPDLVILDVMLPGMNGFEICQKARLLYSHPILILTARGDIADELLGLDSGADDYLAKPVKPQLLLARIKMLLRRSQRYDITVRQIKHGPIAIDANRRMVQIEEQPVDLTTLEFDLLWFLASHAGEVLTRDQISHGLRGHEWDGLDRSIDLGISRLRKKLGDDGKKPERIRSIRGSGYMWVFE